MAGLVQSTTDQGGAKTSAVLTLPSPVAAGNTLILTVAVNNALLGTSTFGAPAGGGVTWQAMAPNSTGNPAIQTWVGVNATGGAVSVSVAIGGPVLSMVAALHEYSGVSAVLPVPDAQATSFTSPPNAVVATAAIPAPSAPDLIHAAWVSAGSPTSVAAPTGGFTAGAYAATALHGSTREYDIALATAWRTTTLPGTYTATWAITNPYTTSTGAAVALRLVGPPAALSTADAGEGGESAMLSGASNIIVPAAVFNVPDRYIFDGTDLSTFAVMQVRTSGGDSHPALRGENPPWAGLPGSQPLEQLPASRIVSLNMYVHGRNPDGTVGAAEPVQARLNLDALQAVLARGGNRQLIRVMPDGTGRQAYAKVWSVQEIDGRQLRSLYALKVDFYLADPYFYSNTVAAGPVALDAGVVNFAITHPGSVRGHHVLFDIAGPVTNPRITNVTTGTWVQFTGAVPNQQRLYIDAEHFSAFLAGANVVGAISHDGGVPFAWLNPGVNTFSVTSSAFGGTISASFSPPFI